MLIIALWACLPPILSDTGMAPDLGDAADTSDSGEPLEGDDDDDGDGFVADDCDDGDSATHPGALEALDFKDQDCDEIMVEAVTDHVGAVSHTATGPVLSIATFAEMGTGGPVVAAGFERDGTNAVVVARLDDLRGDLTGSTRLSRSDAESFGFDLLARDLDGDGTVDLAIGDPELGAYVFVDGSQLVRPGTSVSTDEFPTLADRVGGGAVGFASAMIADTLAVSHVGTAGTSVYLLGAQGLLSERDSSLVEAGVVLSSSPTAGFGAYLAGLFVDDDEVADLVVGAPLGSGLKGQVFMFDGTTVESGASLTDTAADCTLTGEKVTLRIGRGSLGVGDVTGDGSDDMLLAGLDDEARTWYLLPGGLFCGTGEIEDVAISVIRGTNPRVLDRSVGVDFLSATSADLDGDGASELIAGSPTETPGKVYVFAGVTYGQAGGYDLSHAAAGLVGQSADDLFGAVVAVGRSAGDGALLASAPGQEQGIFWSVDLAF
ncbi:MAG: hypothetical protein EXR71_13470 [Myxococcales bacterium]|nr:hypothetical protein [Myxococcales bacterium]